MLNENFNLQILKITGVRVALLLEFANEETLVDSYLTYVSCTTGNYIQLPDKMMHDA